MYSYHIISWNNERVISNYMLADIARKSNVKCHYLYHTHLKIKNVYLRYAYDIPASIGLASKAVKKVLSDTSSDRLVIMTNECLRFFNAKKIRTLKQNGVKLAIILIDPMSAEYPSVEIAKNTMKQVKFDYVFTFDPDDAKTYGYIYTNSLYSVCKDIEEADSRYDFCYMGNLKGRVGLFDEIAKRIEANGVNAYINLFSKDKSIKQLPDSITKSYWNVSYEEFAKKSAESNCIFDITQEHQSGITLRYYEAVVYNKKLLTNNKRITELPFYDPRYMKIYESLDDIDWEWVKKKERIDYGYKGEFSPVHILEQIEDYSKNVK